MDVNVGELRVQTALSDAKNPVVVVVSDEALRKLLGDKKLRVVQFYPETTDGDGKHGPTFKVEIALA